jgi:hypothetical protein
VSSCTKKPASIVRCEVLKSADFRSCTALTEGDNMANGQKPAPKIVVDRNAVNGQFVKPSYAQAHPNTTEREVYKLPKK